VIHSRNGTKLTQTAPVYTAELAPAELRGFFVGMNGVMIALGYSLASYMGLSLTANDSNMADSWQGLPSFIRRTSRHNGEAPSDLHSCGLL
jgi:hypothetical protein